MSVSNQNFLHKMLGTRSAKRRRPYLKKRNEHRLGEGRSYPRELGRWHTSSLNLASEPRTPPVWMCARWIVFIRRKAAPMTMAAQRSMKRSEEHTSELQSRENLVCRL